MFSALSVTSAPDDSWNATVSAALPAVPAICGHLRPAQRGKQLLNQLLMQSNQNHATHNRTTINTLEPESYNMQSNQNHLSIEPKPSTNRTRFIYLSNQKHLSINPVSSINLPKIIYQSNLNHLYNRPIIMQRTIAPESYNQLHVASTEWRISRGHASVYQNASKLCLLKCWETDVR